MGWDNLMHTIVGTVAVASLVVVCVGIALQLLGFVGPISALNCPPHLLLYC